MLRALFGKTPKEPTLDTTGAIELRSEAGPFTVPCFLRVMDDAEPRVLIAEIGLHVTDRLPGAARPHIGQEIEFLEMMFQIILLSAMIENDAIVGQRITAKLIGRAC